MGGPVLKRITTIGPRAVNGLNVASCSWSGPEKSWTVPSLVHALLGVCSYFGFLLLGHQEKLK